MLAVYFISAGLWVYTSFDLNMIGPKGNVSVWSQRYPEEIVCRRKLCMLGHFWGRWTGILKGLSGDWEKDLLIKSLEGSFSWFIEIGKVFIEIEGWRLRSTEYVSLFLDINWGFALFSFTRTVVSSQMD